MYSKIIYHISYFNNEKIEITVRKTQKATNDCDTYLKKEHP